MAPVRHDFADCRADRRRDSARAGGACKDCWPPLDRWRTLRRKRRLRAARARSLTRQLPTPLTTLIGRECLVLDIARSIREGAADLLVIVPAVTKDGESAKRIRRRDQVQNVT